VTGIPNADYYLSKATITSDTVLLCGSASDLRNINKIELGKVDVSGVSSNVIKNFDISAYLPAGITAYQTTNVSVSAEILKYEIKNFTVDIATSVSTPGKNPREYTYEFSVLSFNVKIKGKAADLNNLSVSSLSPELNLTDKGVGEYILPLEFKGIDSTKYTIIGDYTCSVKIEEKIETTPSVPTETPTSEPTPVTVQVE
jgi:YbbR domain-containing protein